MKELTVNEVKEVSGGFKSFSWDGCSFLSPVDAVSWGGAVGSGAGSALGAGGAAAGTSAAMGAGAAWGAAAGLAGVIAYDFGVAVNISIGRCD